MANSGAQRLSRSQDPWEIVADLLDRVQRLEQRRGVVAGELRVGNVQFVAIDNGDGTTTVFVTMGTSTPVPLATLES